MTAARRLAAILPVDVFGDSRLMGEDEAGTAKAVREHRDAAHPITLNANYGFPPTATSTVMIFNDRFTPRRDVQSLPTNVRSGSIAVADDLSKVPEIRAKGASSKFYRGRDAHY